MTFYKYSIAAIALVGITAVASCSSSSPPPPKPVPVPLTCSGGTVVASCLTPVGVCYEYGSDWSVPEAQSDCAIPDNAGAAFRAGVPCDPTDSAGVCTSVEAGEGVIATYYSLANFSAMTAEESCTAVAGTWCSPSAFADAGLSTDSGPALDSATNPLPGPDASTHADAESGPGDGSLEASHDATSDGPATKADGSLNAAVDGQVADVTPAADVLTTETSTDATSIESDGSTVDADDGGPASP